ncbi:winged helix-turn-helix domain-containing protein [Candidatus Thorarchaeota archaeon]|nr:MAG: winged helix-turn-helix domain-containing protein [Candidatus Thorarchaeota archaeon]
MIDKILEIIVDEGITSKREIARQVGVQIETLDYMLELLCQRGYLRISDQNCAQGTSCSGCSMAESCGSTDRLGRVLFITEKGRRYVKARRKHNDG